MIELIEGDVLEVLSGEESSKYTCVFTDTPYGLGFKGKEWDRDVPSALVWEQVKRVSKPGAVMLAYGGSRTFHRLMVNMEDAGLEIYDTLLWLHSSGFPKAYDISKGIDKAAGAEREVIGVREDFAKRAPKNKFNQFDALNASRTGYNSREFAKRMGVVTAPATEDARVWSGYSNLLKPSFEPIVFARNPRTSTYVYHAVNDGTSALNIDECRVETEESILVTGDESAIIKGLWPANILHDGSAEVIDTFGVNNNDGKSNARFFYCAKASRSERNAGLNRHNGHPTIKPLRLNKHLAMLMRPPVEYLDRSILLVPFCGTGSEIIGAMMAGWKNIVGIDNDPESLGIARDRIDYWASKDTGGS